MASLPLHLLVADAEAKVTESLVEGFMDGMIVEDDFQDLENLREVCRFLVQKNGLQTRESLGTLWVALTKAQIERLGRGVRCAQAHSIEWDGGFSTR